MKPLVLIILDGFGISHKTRNNAIAQAKTPNLDRLLRSCPNTTLKASGKAVGLPEGQMGNSEIGHTNIGAGRIVIGTLEKINAAIENGEFFKNPTFKAVAKSCLKDKSVLHVLGILSDGCVHGSNQHLYAFLEFAKREGIKKVFLHCFMDGRDTQPTSGIRFVRELQAKIKEIGVGEIATLVGRFYAMDRDNRWEKTNVAHLAISKGIGEKCDDPVRALEDAYQMQETDEFLKPRILKNIPIKSDDWIICLNFRADRTKQLKKAFEDSGFEHFVTLTRYDKTSRGDRVIFETPKITNGLGEYVSKCNLKQLRIAETEKYAHVTYFFSCGEEKAFPNEERITVASPKVRTYDQEPQMAAREITTRLLEKLQTDKYDLVVVNFANCDMVGHTGNMPATIEAVQVVDESVGKVVDFIDEFGGVVVITADHGNAEEMADAAGGIVTAHTTNEVPFIVAGISNKLKSGGKLCDVAPTILEILGLRKPDEMSGQNLVEPD
ncbi:MAG: 2,3-bisphosphoglycerate-independent phosphoglycerate mutase [Oscillospiraceae bacterium]|nr:2,3-bisphosphoglycerate-independent phosphoglycerate mutase [Oscillospiraceae bacterium]